MLLVRGTKKHVLWFVGVGGWGILLEVVGWMTDWSCCILGCFPAPSSMRGVATDAVGFSGSSLSHVNYFILCIFTNIHSL